MFIIKETEPGLWTIGTMAPEWEPHSDHNDRDEAEQICAHLNGGTVIDMPIEIKELLMDIVYPRRGTEAELYILDPRLVARAESLISKFNLM